MTEEQHFDEPNMQAVALAQHAYQQALAGDWPGASQTVTRLARNHGSEGVLTALMAWPDWFVDYATEGQPVGSVGAVALINADTGALDDVDAPALPGPVRWAAQLIQARAAMDEARFRQLIDEVPDDAGETGQYVACVLETIVRTVNTLPRGYAVMGRRPRGRG